LRRKENYDPSVFVGSIGCRRRINQKYRDIIINGDGKMVKNGVVKSTCAICLSGCGVLVHLQNGKITKIEGAPDAPLNKGSLCPKGFASLEYVYHPNRLKHPLRRTGKRGDGKWQRISWDEALSLIANEMNKSKENYGAESVLFLRGAAKGIQDNVFTRLANAFGSPNITSMAYVCYHPRVNASNITFGSYLLPDYDYPPSCIVVWGSNPEATSIPVYEHITRATSRGAKLIVIDPKETSLSGRATLWIRPRPGSDLALALGMINVVINEGLFDKDFVENWAVGFNELRAHIQAYPPASVEKITWVPADDLIKAVRMYTTGKPGVIQIGNALEQNVNSFQTQRAIYILESISGNIGVPGGEIKWTDLPLVSRGSPTFTLQNNIPPEKRNGRLGGEHMAPFAKYALPQSIIKALIEEGSYRPRVAYIMGANLLTTWSNSEETHKALKKLDFIAVADMFMTPTVEISDLVLPVATYLEFNSISHSAELPYIAQVQQKVVEIGECWSDCKILIELSKRLGIGGYFWNNENEFLNELLKPAGLTLDEFRQVGVISGIKQYRHYRTGGFNTPSGKVELYSSNLKDWGFDPLPHYHLSTQTLSGGYELAGEYPFIITNWKPGVFRHSGLRQIASLRATHPEPIVNIKTETANKLGISEGDWVYIETRQGKIKHKAKLMDTLDPRVVVIDHGWWYPEQGIGNLHGWAESNANILTDNNPPYSPEMGTPTLRGIVGKVYKA
jgi:anaerobic selenocysteine-containing dehydrogenase